MGFDFRAGHGEKADWGVGLWGRGMAAGTGDGILQIQKALFGYAHQGTLSLDTGKDVLNNGSPLIQHQLQCNPLLLKPVNNILCPGAVHLFPAGKGKVDIILRLKALLDQILCRRENTVEGGLGVQGASAPENTVFNHGIEGRFLPVFLFHGHHIVVGHEDGRLTGRLTLPAKQKATIRELLQRAGLKNVRIELRQKGNELFKLGIILQRGVFARDGFAAYERSQTADAFFPVKFHRDKGLLLLRLRCKHPGPGENHHYENKDKIQNHFHSRRPRL